MAFKSFYMTTKVTWGFVSGRKEDFNTVHTVEKGDIHKNKLLTRRQDY
jgi:hypothetical protein